MKNIQHFSIANKTMISESAPINITEITVIKNFFVNKTLNRNNDGELESDMQLINDKIRDSIRNDEEYVEEKDQRGVNYIAWTTFGILLAMVVVVGFLCARHWKSDKYFKTKFVLKKDADPETGEGAGDIELNNMRMPQNVNDTPLAPPPPPPPYPPYPLYPHPHLYPNANVNVN